MMTLLTLSLFSMHTFVYLIIAICLLTDDRIFAGCQLENFAGVNNVAENPIDIC